MIFKHILAQLFLCETFLNKRNSQAVVGEADKIFIFQHLADRLGFYLAFVIDYLILISSNPSWTLLS